MGHKYDQALKKYHKLDEEMDALTDIRIEMNNKISTISMASLCISNTVLKKGLQKEIKLVQKSLKKHEKFIYKLEKKLAIASLRVDDAYVKEFPKELHRPIGRIPEHFEHRFWCSICKNRKGFKCTNKDSEYFEKSIKPLVMKNPRLSCYTHPCD